MAKTIEQMLAELDAKDGIDAVIARAEEYADAYEAAFGSGAVSVKMNSVSSLAPRDVRTLVDAARRGGAA